MKFSEIHSCSCCKAAVHLLGVPGLVPTMPTVLPNLVMSPHPLDGKPFSASRCLLNMTWKVFPGLGFPHQPGRLPPPMASVIPNTLSAVSHLHPLALVLLLPGAFIPLSLSNLYSSFATLASITSAPVLWKLSGLLITFMHLLTHLPLLLDPQCPVHLSRIVLAAFSVYLWFHC